MRKKTKYRSRLLDSAVVFFCLFSAIFFALKFWQDLNAFTTRGDKKSVGTISFKQRVTQRKFDDRVVWERISQGAKLYYGDTIRTADLAQAVIQLEDGTVIDLAENTMIQLLYDKSGALQISVDGGGIHVDSSLASSDVALKLDDGSIVSVDAGTTLSAVSDSKNGIRNVEVTGGSAVVTTESGHSASLSIGESVNIEKGSEIQKNPITVLYPPKNLKLLDIGGQKIPVRFSWSASGLGSEDGGEVVTLQTSFEKDFSSRVDEIFVSEGNSTELTVNKSLYWRIFSESTKDRPVEGKILFDSIDVIHAITPASGEQFGYRNSLPKLNFRWNGNTYAEKYRFSVSATPDMNSPVLEFETTSTFVSIDSLSEGSYWWQVTPYYSLNGIGYAGASRISDFRIVKNALVQNPKLSLPADNAKFTRRKNLSLNFGWKSEVKEAEFNIFIARDKDFTDIAFTSPVHENKFSHEFDASVLEEGLYFWKVVRAPLDSDDILLESDVRSFSVEKYIPEENRLLYPPENFSTEEAMLQNLSFMWRLSDDYKEISSSNPKGSAVSLLQISKNKDFSSLEQEISVDSMSYFGLRLKTGSYWWRVGVKSQDGSVSGLTDARLLTVSANLAPPVIIAPLANDEIIVYGNKKISVKWNEVRDADSYLLKVVSLDSLSGEKSVVYTSSLRSLSEQIALSEGKYEAQLFSVSDSSQLGSQVMSAGSSVQFSVRHPVAVSLLSPSDGSSMSGLMALRSPVTFSWAEKTDRADSYQFILSRQQKNGTKKIVESIKTKKKSVSFERLSSGVYYWRVKASTSDGIPLDSEERRFTIENVDFLPAATLVSPKEDAVFGSEYFKANRKIVFEWKKVPDATEYSFALYKKNADGSLKTVYKKKNLTETSVLLQELSMLDIGTFVWNVTAYRYADDGFEEQKGKVASGSFKIDFELPKQVETKKPKTFYGE